MCAVFGVVYSLMSNLRADAPTMGVPARVVRAGTRKMGGGDRPGLHEEEPPIHPRIVPQDDRGWEGWITEVNRR